MVMKENNQIIIKDDFRVMYLENRLYLMMVIIAFVGILFIIYANVIDNFIRPNLTTNGSPTEGIIRGFGYSVFVASSVGAIISHHYSKYKEASQKAEIQRTLSEVIKHHCISCTKILTNAKLAQLKNFYKDRHGEGETDLRERLNKNNCNKDETIKMMSTTLRVFFNSGAAFTSDLKDQLKNNSKLKLEVLLLNMNSLEAFYRSAAESDGKIKNIKDYKNSGQYLESMKSKDTLENYMSKYKDRINVKYHNNAPYCFLVIFEDECYVSQNLYGDADAQKDTVKTPLLRFGKESINYINLEKHFDFVWKNSQLLEDVNKEMDDLDNIKNMLNCKEEEL